MAQSVPKRMAIISAGVIMNVVFAFIMATAAYCLGVKETPCIIGGVIPGGPAWQANLQPGDVVKRMGDIENPRFRDLQTGVTLGNSDRGVEFEIYRPSTEKTFVARIQPDTSLGVPMVGVEGPAEPTLDEEQPVVDGSPAARAKPQFEGGDTIVQVGDAPTKTQIDIERQLVRTWGKVVEMTAERAVKETNPDRAKPPPERNTANVDAAPLRDFGLVMTMEPISAVQADSPAAEKGIQAGDRLLKIGGEPVGDPLKLPLRMQTAAERGETVQLQLERTTGETKNSGASASESQKQILDFQLKPRTVQFYDTPRIISAMSVPALGIAYKVTAKVAAVEPNSPAAEAKIEPGEEIVSARILPAEKKTDRKQPDPEPLDLTKFPFAWPSFAEALTFLDPQQKVELTINHEKSQRKVSLAMVEMKDAQGQPLYALER